MWRPNDGPPVRLRFATIAAIGVVLLLVAQPASSQTTPARNDLVIDFGTGGLWTFVDGVFSKLLDVSPTHVVAGQATLGDDIDDIAIEITGGLWTFVNNTYWVFQGLGLTPVGMEDVREDFVGGHPNIYAELVVDSCGCRLDAIDVLTHQVFPLWNRGDILDSVVLKGLLAWFPGLQSWRGPVFNTSSGIWMFHEQQAWPFPEWSEIHPLSAQAMVTGHLDARFPFLANPQPDNLAVSFTNGAGTWIFRDSTGWEAVDPGRSALRMAAGDLDGNGVDELLLDFGPDYGIWIYWNVWSWELLHPSTSRHIVVADLDRNGINDIIIDFGPGAGIWVFQNNQSWYQLTALSANQIVVAHLK